MKKKLVLGITLISILISLSFVISIFVIFNSMNFKSKTDLGPDIIIYNGNIITMESDPEQVEAIAIENDSISVIGDESEILPLIKSNSIIIDLGGATLMPGFIDSHAHYIGDRNIYDVTIPEQIENLMSNGWTSISELFVNQERLNELITLDQNGELPIRVNAYLPLNYRFDKYGDWYKAYSPGYEYSPNLRIAGVKLFMDYFILENVLFFQQDELNLIVQEAHDLGFQIAIHSHSSEDATNIVLNAFQTVLGGESNQLYRHRIEHCAVLYDNHIQRMADLGIIASIQLPWFSSHTASHVENDYPAGYTNLVARWRDLLEAGVPTIGGTDYPWPDIIWSTNGSVLKTLYRTITRKSFLSSDTPPDWMLKQTLSIEQAIPLLTINGAYGTFQEDIKGSIKENKLADLVILSDNPMTVTEDELLDIDVILTMIGGNIEYELSNQEKIDIIQGQDFINEKNSITHLLMFVISFQSTIIFKTFLMIGILGIIYIKMKTEI